MEYVLQVTWLYLGECFFVHTVCLEVLEITTIYHII